VLQHLLLLLLWLLSDQKAKGRAVGQTQQVFSNPDRERAKDLPLADSRTKETY
jgi:hypothetical protein